ncbi:MAG: hypothetical protein JXA09_04270 [Anaerolineae bacterium]|nr:hypothetical protein [Anaerolineae bacterium]
MSDNHESDENRTTREIGEPVFKAPPGAPVPEEELDLSADETALAEEPPTVVEELPPPAPPIARVPPAPAEAAPPPPPARARQRRMPSVFWPMVLIGAGVLLLLSNLGYVSWSSWNLLWRLWPLLLIALGVDVLIGRRSAAGAIVNGLLMLVLVGGVVALVLFAQYLPVVSEWTAPAEWQVRHVEHPLGDVTRADVELDLDSVRAYIGSLDDSPNLIEGEIAYAGELVFEVVTRGDHADVRLDRTYSGPPFGPFGPLGSIAEADRRWDVELSPRALLDLRVDAGSSGCELDLSGLQIGALELDVGSGSVDLSLPAQSSFSAVIDGGSGGLTLVVPPSVGARIELDAGTGSFQPGERFDLVSGESDDDGVWESENWDTAEQQIVLVIDQGSGRVRVR